MKKIILTGIMLIFLVSIVKGSTIAEDVINWNFLVLEQDKEYITLEYEGNNTFSYEIRVNNLEAISPFYTAKAVINYTTNEKENSIMLRSNLEPNDSGTKHYFTIPEDMKSFKITIGETSTTIDATASTTATKPGSTEI